MLKLVFSLVCHIDLSLLYAQFLQLGYNVKNLKHHEFSRKMCYYKYMFLGEKRASFLEMSCICFICQMRIISNTKNEIVIVGKVRGITQKCWGKSKNLSVSWQEPVICLGECHL